MYIYIYIYDLKTKKSTLLYQIDTSKATDADWSDLWVSDVRVSPNGKYVKFSRKDRLEGRALYVVDLEGNVVYKNASILVGENTFDWLPDGEHLIGQVSIEEGVGKRKYTLSKINVETGKITTEVEMKGPVFMMGVRVSSDGKYYYGYNPLGKQSMFLFHLKGELKGEGFMLIRGYGMGDWYYDKDNFVWES